MSPDASMLLEFAKYAPVPIGCLVVIYMLVKVFIKHLEKRDEVLGEISDRCHAVQQKATDAMVENSRALGAVMQSLERINGSRSQL